MCVCECEVSFRLSIDINCLLLRGGHLNDASPAACHTRRVSETELELELEPEVKVKVAPVLTVLALLALLAFTVVKGV